VTTPMGLSWLGVQAVRLTCNRRRHRGGDVRVAGCEVADGTKHGLRARQVHQLARPKQEPKSEIVASIRPRSRTALRPRHDRQRTCPDSIDEVRPGRVM